MGDNITKPDHYCDGRKYEPKDVIRDWGLNFNLGSAVKYISRAGRKGDKLEDLRKARQFLEFEIEAEEKEENSDIEIEKERKTCLYVNGLLSQIIDYDCILSDEYRHRAVDKIAQEVLDLQRDINNDIPTDNLRMAVIDRIVERINNGELSFHDIPWELYSMIPVIREALTKKDNPVSINFEFEVDPDIDTDAVNVHVYIKNKED